MTSRLNATSVCVGSACLNETDIQGLKTGSITSFVCSNGSCLNSTDIARVKSIPQSVNSTQHCIGPDCLVSTDLTTLKTLPSVVNSSLICAGTNCLNSTDFSILRTVINSLPPPPYKELDTNSIVDTLAGSTTFHSDGIGQNALFFGPTAITLSSNGTIYVADSTNHVIRAIAVDGTVSTIAGFPGAIGYKDGQGQEARFRNPQDIAVSSDGTVYVLDTDNHRVRVISASGLVSTIAGGSGVFTNPKGLALAPSGILYVSDSPNNRIRAISPNGIVTTLVGSTSGSTDGDSSTAKLWEPVGLCVADNGTIFVAENYNRRIRMISPSGFVTTIAGNGNIGSLNGAAVNATFFAPYDVSLASDGTLYIADSGNQLIRKLSPNGIVSTTTGGNSFSTSRSIAVAPNGTIYVSEVNNNRIRTLSPSGSVSTVAGGVASTATDGQGSAARFNYPRGMSIAPNGTIYLADSSNHQIRSISPNGQVRTVAGSTSFGSSDGQGTAARFYSPYDVAVSPNGTIYVAEYSGHRIRAISPFGYVTTVAGTGTNGFADGPGATAQFSYPGGIVVSPNGTLFVVEVTGNRIRTISPDGIVSLFAGSNTSALGTTDGQGAAARFGNPYGITLSANGTLYVAEAYNQRIRAISPNGMVTTIAGGTNGYADGQGTSARFNYPYGIVSSPNGVLYVADTMNNCIRAISPTGNVTTITGNLVAGHLDGVASNSMFSYPFGLALSPDGTLYVSDTNNHRIRRIRPQ